MPINPRILEFARTTREPKQPSIGRRVVGRSQVDPEILAHARQAREELQLRQQQEQQQPEDPYLRRAREELKESHLPGVKAYAIQAGAGITSLGARLLKKGEYADRMIRFSAAVEQAAREREKGGLVPDILQSGVRGAGVSLTTMGAAGMVGGPYAAIAAAAAEETNSAITGGKDAGLKGHKLAGYAVGQGVWEGIPASIMQRAGLGGVESLFGKKVVSAGLIQGLKRLGILAAQEVPEEIVTELGHSVAAKIFNVDPGALNPENLKQVTAETTVQTLITVAFGGAPSVARSVKAGKVEQITREAVTYVEKNKVPSRKIWRQWGLAPELGESRKQRRAFTQEIAGQLEAPVEVEPELIKQPIPQEGLEAAREPVVTPEAPVVPEVPGAIMEPEAVQEGVEPPVEPGITPPVRAEVVEGLEAPATETETIALNKASGVEIRELLGIDQLPKGRVRSAEEVMERVAAGKGDEKAIDVAQEIIRTPRMLKPYEHVSMVLKARKLLKDLKIAKIDQAEAGQTGDVAAHKKAIIDRETIAIQLDDLTAASQYSGTEISEAFSIRKLRLSLESYDIIDVLQEMQAVKKFGDRISKKARDSAVRLTQEGDVLTEKIAKLEKEIRIRDEKLEAVLAQKVVNALRPRKKVGRSIREKAIIEREDIKKRIRQLGVRVNDITGVSAEGTYLIGRLGITYIKEGAGTLIEVAERLRADMPDLNLSDHDVNQALISRSPKEKARVRSETAKRVAELKSLARMHVELHDIADRVAIAAKKKAPVSEDIKKLRKILTKARYDYYYSDIEAAKLERAIDKINLLQTQLDGDLERAKKTPKEVSATLMKVNETIRELTAKINIKEKLAETERQLRTGEVPAAPKRIKKPIDPELERMQIQLAQNRRAIRQLMADQAPWDTARVIDEVFESSRVLMATGEVSFTLRQNMLQTFSHPVKAAENFGKSLAPIFQRDTADQINHRLKTSPNAAIYDLSKIAILDSESSSDAQRSEVFRGNVIQKVPVLGSIIRASARHSVAYSNMMRTGGMDWFVSMYPNATRAELNAWADWQNTSSGLGSLWHFAQAAKTVGKVIFAPKFSASRIQTPFKVFQYWQYPRVRKAIARDMVRAVSTGVGIMSLAALAGAEVVWDDPDNADWWKIRIGNTRFDFWGGFQQPARVVARILRGATVRTGLIEEGVSYKLPDFLELFGRFAAFKVSPPVSIVRELLTGKTAVGEEATLAGTAVRHTTMLFLQDVYDVAREYNSIPAAAGVGIAAGLGVGVATYKDSETATRKKIKKLRQSDKYKKAEFLRLKWNRENPKNRIVTIK